MAQSDSLPDEVAAEIAKLDKRLRDLERTPQLTRSSIDDGRLVSKDRDGRVREVIGKQVDGSIGSRVVESPDQPTPSAPGLIVGKAGVVTVRWDGEADAPVPLVHGHIEVQIAYDGTTWEAVSTIRDRAGGATSFVADQAGTVSVRLVLVGQDRVTRGEPSEVSTVDVELPVDVGDIEAKIEAFSDGELNDQAYNNLMARLGEFLVVNAGQINANDIVTNSALVAELEAHGITLSAEANGRRFEISGTGWKLTDTSTGEVLASLGVDGELLARGATIEGGTVTGSTFETSPDWASAGGATMRADGQYGHFVAAASDGTIMARLGGDENQLTGVDVTGTFRTSYPNGAGVTIDRGSVTYWSASDDAMVTRQNTPYLRLTPRDGEKDRDPVIATDGQRLVLAGGRDSGGNDQPVMIDGPVEAKRVNATYEVTGSTLTLTSQSDGTVTQLNRTGLTVDPFASQPTGISRSDARTQLVGRMADGAGSTTLLHLGNFPDYWDVASGSNHRVNLSFGSPAPFGIRKALVTAQVSSGSYGWENSRSISLSVTKEGAGGFSTVGRAPASNGGTVRYMINYVFGWK